MRLVLCVVLVGLLAVGGLEQSFAQGIDERPVEYDLAIIQSRHYVAPDDPLVVQFGTVLDRLADRCQETRKQLGGSAVAVLDYLQQQGVYTATPLSLLVGLDGAVPTELFGPDHLAKCSEVLGMVGYLASVGE